MKLALFCLILTSCFWSAVVAAGEKMTPPKVEKKTAAVATNPQAKLATATSASSVSNGRRVPNSVANNIGSIASVDSNRSLEIRGQARTLSMMLVLKNKKDAIDFIKPRKDYASEIRGTEY